MVLRACACVEKDGITNQALLSDLLNRNSYEKNTVIKGLIVASVDWLENKQGIG